ncbi:MAG TPA: ATP-binding protein, partial [Coriobacteriia bacterium]
LEHPELEVFLGTPTEIAATVHALAREELDSSRLLFCDEPDRLPVWQRLAVCADAAEVVGVARAIGLTISERTAHRLLGGELPVLDPILRVVMPAAEPPADRKPDIYRDRRGLRVHHADLGAFRRGLEDAFDTLGERYYLHLKGEPRVTVGRDTITVRFDIEKDD